MKKALILAAGRGKRLDRKSKPKPLVSVAGKTSLDHLLDMFKTVPDPGTVEYVIILGPYLGEGQIPPYMEEHYPGFKVNYVLQTEMRGQSDALYLARQHLSGPMLMCFADTLMQTDFSFLAGEEAEAVAWVKPVPDPRRFGVAEVNKEGWVTRLVEKPSSLENNLVLVGCYYFREAGDLLAAIEEQMRRGTSLKGEYFLTDAINILLEGGAKVRTRHVDVWLDTGTIAATLETNRYLLEHGAASTPPSLGPDVTVVPPVFIDPTAEITAATIGPHVSIGAGCKISASRIEDSILEPGVTVEAAALKGSIIGRRATVRGRGAGTPPVTLNLGDDSSVIYS